MPNKDNWNYVRRQCDHFTPSELELITRRFDEGVKAISVARELKCSSRVIYTHYAAKRGSNPPYRPPTKPIVPPKRRPVINKAARFYHSTFEPT